MEIESKREKIKEINIPGLELVSNLDAEKMKEIVDNFCNALFEQCEKEIEQGYKPTLIFPLNGGFFAFWEFAKLLASKGKLEGWVNLNFAIRDDLDTYQILDESRLSDKVHIVDDIFDSGASSQEIKSLIAAKVEDPSVDVWALSTKVGRGYQGIHGTYFEFEDEWVTSGFGMNSSQLFPEEEMLERVAGISYYIIDAIRVGKWNDSELEKYISAIRLNPYIFGSEREEFLKLFRCLDVEDLSVKKRNAQILLEKIEDYFLK